MSSKDLSRRRLMQSAGALAGGLAASRVMNGGPGGLISRLAQAQVVPEKSAVLAIFLQGGYNSVFCSADSFAGAGTFGVTANNQKALANGLVIDSTTLGTLPQYALDHMATVGVRHGITSHGAAQTADFSDGKSSYALMLADAMGGDASIKAVQAGSKSQPGPHPAVNGTSLQVITDMKSTIAALGGITDPTIPDRGIGANGLIAAQAMSLGRMAQSPVMTTEMHDGYAAAITTLQAPVKPFDYTALATAYGFQSTQTSVNNFTAQIACAELMITAGANYVVAVDGGWDSHGDKSASSVRSMMNSRILPPLKVFINRMMNQPNQNVVVAIFGDFARSLPGSDHASSLSATVIGKYVKVGTTGKMSASVTQPSGTPSIPGLWSYLAAVTKAPSSPFGANQHPSLLV